MSRKVWLVSSRLAVRNGLRRPSRSCSLSPATHSAGQHARVGAVFQRQPQRPGPQLDRAGRRPQLVEDHRQVLPLARRLALDVDELRRMRHRIEDDDELGRQLQRQERLLAGRQLDRVEGDLLRSADRDHPGRSTPELQKIWRKYSANGSSSGSCAAIRRTRAADREGHLDHLVERRLVAGGAPARSDIPPG